MAAPSKRSREATENPQGKKSVKRSRGRRTPSAREKVAEEPKASRRRAKFVLCRDSRRVLPASLSLENWERYVADDTRAWLLDNPDELEFLVEDESESPDPKTMTVQKLVGFAKNKVFEFDMFAPSRTLIELTLQAATERLDEFIGSLGPSFRKSPGKDGKREQYQGRGLRLPRDRRPAGRVSGQPKPLAAAAAARRRAARHPRAGTRPRGTLVHLVAPERAGARPSEGDPRGRGPRRIRVGDRALPLAWRDFLASTVARGDQPAAEDDSRGTQIGERRSQARGEGRAGPVRGRTHRPDRARRADRGTCSRAAAATSGGGQAMTARTELPAALSRAEAALQKNLLWNAARTGALGAMRDRLGAIPSRERFVGCGSWAFVWSLGPERVFKLTRDIADGIAALEIERLRTHGRLAPAISGAMANVHAVRSVSPLEDGHGNRICLLVAERLGSLTAGEVATLRAIHAERRHICGTVETVEDFVRRGPGPWTPPGAAPEEAHRVWKGWVGLARIGVEHGVRLERDAHAGNWGKDEAGQVKLFDFGQSSVGHFAPLPPELLGGPPVAARLEC
ncbi:MAG TPA: hypothetical protein VHF22_14090 [Planctomycetota bacterium]|nr:hypothetical protein [Planctomycetota bacterium]